MPRGAIPTPRSELAASEPYQPDPAARIFVPSGDFPSPNHELAAAQPYRANSPAPESFLAWPVQLDSWKSAKSTWAEEAFAKACVEPKHFISADAVLAAARECGASNFSEFMQTHGFQIDGVAYLDGPFHSINWTNTAALHAAIANVGPVKIGVASGNLTPGPSGWAIYGLSPGQPEDYCASLCGYGPLPALIDLFEQHGIQVTVPPGMPSGVCYAMFTGGSIGIIDHQSLMNITGEAWVRNPTTLVKALNP